jgi:hypothetical protein
VIQPPKEKAVQARSAHAQTVLARGIRRSALIGIQRLSLPGEGGDDSKLPADSKQEFRSHNVHTATDA